MGERGRLASAAKRLQHGGVGRYARVERIEGLGRDGVLAERGFLVGDAGKNADFANARFPPVAQQQRRGRLELVDQVEMALRQRRRRLEPVEVEGLTRAEIDRAGQLVLDQIGRRVLVDVDTGQQLGGDILQAELIGAARGEDVASVEFGADLRQTADRDRAALAILALHLNARDALQGFGDVAVGQLADVFGDDGIDDDVGIALDRLGARQAGAHAGDDDCCRVVSGRFLRRGGGVLCEGLAGQQQAGDRNPRQQGGATRRVSHPGHETLSSPWPLERGR